jgi:hypothetical protein
LVQCNIKLKKFKCHVVKVTQHKYFCIVQFFACEVETCMRGVIAVPILPRTDILIQKNSADKAKKVALKGKAQYS